MILAVQPADVASLLSSLAAGLERAVRVAALGVEDGVRALVQDVSEGSTALMDATAEIAYLLLLLAVSAVGSLAAHGRDGLDLLGRAVGEVAWVGVLCGGGGGHGCCWFEIGSLGWFWFGFFGETVHLCVFS